MKRIEFKPPKGFMLPEGTAGGDEFDSLCRFRLKSNGAVCMIMMGDTPMPGYGDKDKHQSDGMKELGEGYAGRVREQMGGSY